MSFDSSKIAPYAAFARTLADAARGPALALFRQGAPVDDKDAALFDPVTDADRNAERAIRDLIQARYPGHAILGEEHGETPGSEPWRWVIDPIDGTRAYITGATSWTCLIALEHQGTPALGLIDQAYNDERWIGDGRESVFMAKGRERRCRTSGLQDLSRARLSTTDPRSAQYFSEREATGFATLAEATRVARFSLDGYAYGLLALGEIDLVVETGLAHHDYAALIPVIEGAGGVVSNWSGGAVGSDGRGEFVAAASPGLLAAALSVLKPYISDQD